jgi:N-acetylglutamate synthase
MSTDDFEAILHLWQRTPGIKISEADTREGLAAYFERNPGLSFVARTSTEIIGTIMAGHDGRRGYLQHLAVDTAYRRQGIGTNLVHRSLAALAAMGISRAHLFALEDNESGQRFWQRLGWKERREVVLFSAWCVPPDTQVPHSQARS